MKSHFLLFGTIFLFLTTLAQAQSWGADGARWVYDYSNFSYLGFSEIVYEKDTLVNNEAAKKFSRKTKYRHQVLGINSEYKYAPIIMIEKQDVVFLLTESGFDTLYNFTANVGDKWGIQRRITADTIITEVLENGFKELNTQVLKWQLVQHYLAGYPQYAYQDTVVEGIGSINHYLLPWDYFAAQVDAHQGGRFRCYNDNDFGIYQNPAYDLPCDFVTATNEIELNNFIQIAPNPFTDVIKISFAKPTLTETDLVIYSAEGRVIKKMKLLPNTAQFAIPAVELYRGYYFITIIEQGAVRYVTKIVKM